MPDEVKEMIGLLPPKQDRQAGKVSQETERI